LNCLSFYLIASIVSAHINATADLNENNPGLGLGCQLRPAFAVEAGFFEDSYSNTTVYGIGIVTTDIGPLEIGAFAGIARYPDADINIALPSFHDWIPVAGLQAGIGPVLLRLLPQDGVIADAVVTLQLRTIF